MLNTPLVVAAHPSSRPLRRFFLLHCFHTSGQLMLYSSYKVLEQAAGSRGLQRGQQYAILEDDGFGGRHRIIVGVVSDSMSRGARFLDWSQTTYHNVLFDELDSRSCRPLVGVWNPFRASSHHHGFLGMVRPGANLQRIGEEYLMRAGKRFNVRNWRL